MPEASPLATTDPAISGLVRGKDGHLRCYWCQGDELYVRYHDNEWGVPTMDDRSLFEKICLEGFQSGLSWLTILRKREAFREAFRQFDFRRVAQYGEPDVERLVANAGIVRHRGKIVSTINNARRACELAGEFGTLAGYFWQWEPSAGARPGRIDRRTLESLTFTQESTALAKDLKRRGWSYVGPTTAYAFMQAMGLVNDHIEGCWRRPHIEELRSVFVAPESGLPVRR